MKKTAKYFFILLIVVALSAVIYFFMGKASKQDKIIWGVSFSAKQAENLGLDARETYSSLINELGVKRIKISVHWDLIEPKSRVYDFQDLDWEMEQAKDKGVKIILAIGMKTPRWPECHIPEWAKNFNSGERNKEILEMIKTVVLRYGSYGNLYAWQVENEPFFSFGQCPKIDTSFLKEEIDLVKSLDSGHKPVIITDTGEQSFWLKSARFGDILGATIYRKLWSNDLNMYITYPYPPVFYWRKAQIAKYLFKKDVIGIELQAEPWARESLKDLTKEEQEKTMNLAQFIDNVEFAKETGFKEFYFWGSEWWYWLKTKKNDSRIWDEAKKLF